MNKLLSSNLLTSLKKEKKLIHLHTSWSNDFKLELENLKTVDFHLGIT